MEKKGTGKSARKALETVQPGYIIQQHIFCSELQPEIGLSYQTTRQLNQGSSSKIARDIAQKDGAHER
ncbi:hypothetical protein ABF86_03385 [Nitrosomonas sp. GH22]|nr:hypothetical protein [Nitrosomonas sp. GH22]